MTVTPQDVITQVRRLVQDEDETYRYSDTFLLGLVNQGLKRMALVRPDLFTTVGTVTCTQGEVSQSAPSDSIRLIEVLGIDGGNALVEVNREALDRNTPGWRAASQGAATNWMRDVRNPNKFFIYPPAPSGQDLVVEYSQSPSDYAIDATILLLPDAFFPVVVDVTVWLVESVDNENVSSNRAKMFYDSWTQALGLTVQNRSLTDPERGGMSDEEVL